MSLYWDMGHCVRAVHMFAALCAVCAWMSECCVHYICCVHCSLLSAAPPDLGPQKLLGLGELHRLQHSRREGGGVRLFGEENMPKPERLGRPCHLLVVAGGHYLVLGKTRSPLFDVVGFVEVHHIHLPGHPLLLRIPGLFGPAKGIRGHTRDTLQYQRLHQRLVRVPEAQHQHALGGHDDVRNVQGKVLRAGAEVVDLRMVLQPPVRVLAHCGDWRVFADPFLLRKVLDPLIL
mmetsp:Transcript_22357/g.49755  ORF Transcript_22357/g.49755 Transcript_22357/m.49755 type:complete len:233 (-) Transcript_22357:607-1305(-)